MRLKYFFKFDHKKQPIAGSNIRRKSKPGSQWAEIIPVCCDPDDIVCLCDWRYFVQIDGTNRPVDGTLIKRRAWPKMDEGIRYQEIQAPNCCVNSDLIVQWDSPDDMDITMTTTTAINSTTQGIYNVSWGFANPSRTGLLAHSRRTDVISFAYTSSGAFSLCVHLKQNGVEVTGSPFSIAIPGAGSSSFNISGLDGKISGNVPLTILVNAAC